MESASLALFALCKEHGVTATKIRPLIHRFPSVALQTDRRGHHPLRYLCLNVTITPEALRAFLEACPASALEQDLVRASGH